MHALRATVLKATAFSEATAFSKATALPKATAFSEATAVSRVTAFSVTTLLAIFCLLATGCGLEQKAQWQNAPNAQQFFSNAANNSALVGNDITELGLACEDMLEPARTALDNPGSPGLRVMIQVCSQEGLGFGGELRCKDDTLQVSCL